MVDISDEEQDYIKEVRLELQQQLTAKYNTDYNLLRWLRGWNRDRGVALTKLKAHLKLRKAMDLDNIQSKDSQDLDSISPVYAPVSVLGRNGVHDNKLVVFEFPGRCDINGMLLAVQTTPFMLGRFRLLENILDQLNALELASGRMSGAVFIFDLEGLVLDPALLPVVTGPFRIMWGTLMEHYPEWIHKLIVINVPTFMSVLWRAFQPFVPEHTKEKIVFASGNWREELLQYVDAAYLPAHFGGTLRDDDGDEWCRSKIRVPPAGKVPTSLYWRPVDDQPTIQRLTPLTVSAGAKNYFAYEITEPCTTIEFFLYTEHEYTFCIYFCEDTEKRDLSKDDEVLIDNERPGMSTVDNFKHVCSIPGAYVIKFGNEKAWFLSVVVKYELRFFNSQGEMISPKLISEWSAKK